MQRIEQLDAEHRDLMTGFRVHYAERNPTKLEEEQRRYFAKLAKPHLMSERIDTAPLLEDLFSLGARLARKVS